MPVLIVRQDAAAPPPPPGGGPPPMTPEMLAALPHDNDGPKLNAVIWTLTGVSALFLCLRLYCKQVRSKGLWWDDWILLAAWIAIFLECIFVSLCISMYGFGKHSWDVPFEEFSSLFKTFSVAGTLSICSSVWSKTSFALTILRLTDGWPRRGIWLIIILINVFMGITALINYIHCWPVAKIFDFTGTVPGTCWPIEVVINYDIFSAVFSGAMDITLALIPWKLIWGLQMRQKEKIGVAIAMSMGLFAGAMSFVKAGFLWTMATTDIYQVVDLNYWTNAECAVTIMAASIPVLRVLLSDVTKSMNSRSMKSYFWSNVASSWKTTGTMENNSETVIVSDSQRTIQHKDSWPSHPAGRIVRTNNYDVEFSEK